MYSGAMPYKDKDKQREAQRIWARANRESINSTRDKRRRLTRDKMRKAKESPCVDCKNSYPYYVMQFDHTEDNKVDCVSRLAHHSSWEATKKEIEKCELVCANCHAIRTYKRKIG